METVSICNDLCWQPRVGDKRDAPRMEPGLKLTHTIVPVSNRDSDRVLDFLRQFFFKDEPLNICVGMADEPGSTCAELENFCMETIPEGASLMAVTPSGKILGVCLNGVASRHDKEAEDDLGDCSNPKFSKILNLLGTVCRQGDVFGKFPDIDRILEIRVVSVDDTCRGQGIAKSLFDRTKLLAKEMGVSMVKVDCTSHFSALAVAKLGFTCVYELQYAQYLGQDGEPVFVPEPPHSCVKTFVHSVAR